MQTRPTQPRPRLGTTEFRRTRYFARMVVSPEDLTRDQDYQSEKRQFWNLVLHGWGIVRHLELALVREGQDPPLLRVTQGAAIARDGDEVLLPRAVRIDPAAEDGQGNARVVDGDLPTPAEASTRSRRRPGATYLVAVHSKDLPSRYVRAPFGPRPDGSGACEPSVLIDSCDFRLFDEAETSHLTLSAAGWVVLGALTDYGKAAMAVDPAPRDVFPIDPWEPDIESPGQLGEMISAVEFGELGLAERHLNAWKGSIARALKKVLKPAGLERLAAIGPTGSLAGLPALDLADCPDDADGAWHMNEFLRRARSRHAGRNELSIVCLADVSDADFLASLREAYPRDLISDRVARHTHRAACLVFALVKQWPAPSFRELVS